MLVAETIASADFCSDLVLLKNLLLTEHTAWCWLTMLQMVFSLLVCVVPLVKMMVQRNKLGMDTDSRTTYQKILAFFVVTCLLIPLLLLLDIFFMVITIFGGYISIFMYMMSLGKIKMTYYMIIQDKIFYWVFNMRKNDIEGMRRARNISQLLFETIPQVALQIRIIFWIWNHPANQLAKLDIEHQLLASIASGVVHALMETFQIYNEAKAANMKIVPYAIVCLNGRFDWLPHEEFI